MIKELLRKASQPSGKIGIATAITLVLSYFGISDNPELTSNIAGILVGIASIALVVMDQKA